MPAGLEILVPAPRPMPRPWATAITSYSSLANVPGFGPDAKGVQRWLNGVKFLPYGCDNIVGEVFDPCVARTSEYQEGFDEIVAFQPFLAEVAIQCSVVGTTRAELEAYLLAMSEAGRSSVLGAQVERDAIGTGNPSLASEAQVLSNADQSLLGAAIAVEEALADVLDGGVGTIHLAPGLFVAYANGGGAHLGADNIWRTVTGHVIVADAGYIGASPATEGAVNGELWVYGSGPVFAQYGGIVTYNGLDNEVIDFTRDQWNVKVEQYGIAIFEPCSVVAALVDVSDSDVVND